MPESLQASLSAGAFGRQYDKDISVVSETGQPFSPTIGRAWEGQLTTRTDNDTGVITMADAGHVITTGCKVMVYWEYDAGAPTVLVSLRRRFLTVGAVVGTAVPIDLGAGSNLPTNLSNVIVCKMEQVNVAVVGNDIVGIVAAAGASEVNIVFNSSAPAELLYIPLIANDSYVYTSGIGVANPLAGVTVATVWCGHNSLAATVVAGAVLFN